MGSRSPPKKTSSSSGRPPTVKFARRTSSGRVVSMSRDDEVELGLSSEFGPNSDQPNDYINYTVLMPPTPDNQPSEMNPDDIPPLPYAKRGGQPGGGGRGGAAGGGGGDMGQGAVKLGRTMSVMKSNNKSILLRSHTGEFDHNRWLFETKGTYGIGNAFWTPEGMDGYGDDGGVSMADFMDKPWKPLTRKVRIPSSILSPYRYVGASVCV